jgi:hypothetical protein
MISCEKQENGFPYDTCVKGKVIGYEGCGEGSLIQVESLEHGTTVVYHDNILGDTTYANVLKSPGIYPKGIIYFKAREYNSETDNALFLGINPSPCQMVFGPYSVPIIVITEYSQIKCP